MYFSKAFITSALLGAAAATTHPGEAPAAHTVSVLQAHSSAAKVAAPSAHATQVVQNKGHNNVAAEGTVVTHVVQVGGPNGTLRFYPDNVIAKPGELVQFQFNPKVGAFL
jgi:plastocyanin